MANKKPHDEDADLRALAIHQYWLRSNKLPTKDISSDSKLSKISFLASKSSNLYDLLKGETTSIRERVLAMVEVRGVHLPKISSTGDAVFFIQDTDGNEKVVERNSPFDPTDQNGKPDIYRWDLVSGEIKCLTAQIDHNKWIEQYALSGDGSTLAFADKPKAANDIHRLIVLNHVSQKVYHPYEKAPLELGEYGAIPEKHSRQMFSPSLNYDGSTLFFGAGTWQNNYGDPSWHGYHLCAWNSSKNTLKALTPQTNIMDMPTVSADGSTVIFQSTPESVRQTASGYEEGPRNRVVYLLKQATKALVELPLPDGMIIPYYEHWNVKHKDKSGHERTRLAISHDGRLCVFTAEDPKAKDKTRHSQLYLFSADTGELTLLSASEDSTMGQGHSYDPVISGDGKIIAFCSEAQNLPGKQAKQRILLYHVESKKLEPLPLQSAIDSKAAIVRNPSLNFDGSLVAFIAEVDILPGVLSDKILSEVKPKYAKRLYVYDRKREVMISLGGSKD